MIRAITFDFWDTIAIDDSDEPRRATLGLPTKPQARLLLFMSEILRHHPNISPEQIVEAFHHANERFRHLWKNEHVTLTVAERLRAAYAFLGIAPTPGFSTLVRDFEEMEVHIPPSLAPGVQEALASLSERYRLGIVSDTIHTPGRGIRQILAHYGLARHFACFVFSDEAGAAKPNPMLFQRAAAGLGVSLSEMAHVGDRESNDVSGALAAGMKAILFAGVVDRGSSSTRAHAVCRHFADLPGIVAALDEGPPEAER